MKREKHSTHIVFRTVLKEINLYETFVLKLKIQNSV
ncbi:hypothetical protein ABIE26_001029 [Pedobacter africanus]|uniref:Uncharacterized protein n=1 Tax=Pedobacter africanus TaxID=151894 RepID=A0ACC6KTM2_9SPHI|nr:hypothetical protein [Pedobacter africanus]